MTSLRPAQRADAAEIARIHVHGWQAGCVGIVAADYLDGLSIPEARARWESALDRSGHQVIVATTASGISGFARTGITPDPRPGEDPVPGELRELYVDPQHWGTGVAAELHRQAIADLAAAGFATAVLWVVAGNERARRFYQRRGWRPDGWQREERAGEVTWTEHRMTGSLT